MTYVVRISGVEELRSNLQDFSARRMNAAIATALTRTAVQVRDTVKRQLPVVFDRPTPYTMNSLYVKGATASRLAAETYFKDDRATSRAGTPSVRFLMPHVEGGARRIKRFERALQITGNMPDGWQAVPAKGARLDAWGNISLGQIVQILSQLRVTLVAGHARNMSFLARKQIAAQRKAGGRFFVVMPGSGLQPGIYQRELIGRNITPVMIYVRHSTYTKRFDFDGMAGREAMARLPENVGVAIAEQLERLAMKA